MFPGWTEDTEAVLRQGVEKGLSASEIAKVLGKGCTRNAVIGKVARLGLTLRGEQPPRPWPPKRRVLKPKIGRPSAPPPEWGSPSAPRRFSWEQPLDPDAERA